MSKDPNVPIIELKDVEVVFTTRSVCHVRPSSGIGKSSPPEPAQCIQAQGQAKSRKGKSPDAGQDHRHRRQNRCDGVMCGLRQAAFRPGAVSRPGVTRAPPTAEECR